MTSAEKFVKEGSIIAYSEKCQMENELTHLLGTIDGTDIESLQKLDSVIECGIKTNRDAAFQQLVDILSYSKLESSVFYALVILKKYEHAFENRERIFETTVPLLSHSSRQISNLAANVLYVYCQIMEDVVVPQLVCLLTEVCQTGDTDKLGPYLDCLNQFVSNTQNHQIMNTVMKTFCDLLQTPNVEMKRILLEKLCGLVPQLYQYLGSNGHFASFTQMVCRWLADAHLKSTCYAFLRNAIIMAYDVIECVAQDLVGMSLSDLQQTTDVETVLTLILMWITISQLEESREVSHMIVVTVSPTMVPLLAHLMSVDVIDEDFTCHCSWNLVSASFQCLMQFARHLFHIVDPLLMTLIDTSKPIFTLRVLSIVAATSTDELLAQNFESMIQFLELCCAATDSTFELRYWTIYCLKKLAKRASVDFSSISKFCDYANAILKFPSPNPEPIRCAASFYCRVISKLPAFDQGKYVLKWLESFNEYPISASMFMFELVTDIIIRPQNVTVPGNAPPVGLCKIDQDFARQMRVFIRGILESVIMNPDRFLQFIETLGYTLLLVMRDSKLQLDDELDHLWALAKNILKMPGQTTWLLFILYVSYCNSSQFAKFMPDALPIIAAYLADEDEESYRAAVTVLTGTVIIEPYAQFQHDMLQLLVLSLGRESLDATLLSTIVSSCNALLHNELPEFALSALAGRVLEFLHKQNSVPHSDAIRLFDAVLSLSDTLFSIPVYIPLASTLLTSVLESISRESDIPETTKATIRTLLAQLALTSRDDVIEFLRARPTLASIILDV